MRILFILLAGFVVLPLGIRGGTQPGKSALETDSSGWLDLLPGKDLKGWKRVPIAPDVKLAARNPWSVAGKVLRCDGVGIKEMFLYERPFADGIYHVEWRFRPQPMKAGKKNDYNSGIYVRTAGDGMSWLQAQVAHLEKPPRAGDLFGELTMGGKAHKVLVQGQGHRRVHPPGQWNTYEITCQGKKVTVLVNGAVVTTMTDCPVAAGHVGLQAEYWFIEFRNLKFKEFKDK